MRRSIFDIGRILVVFAVITLLTVPAQARDGNEGPFGLGISVGEPTGVTAKYFFGENVAVDGLVGVAFADETALQLQADILWHFDDQPGVNDSPWMAVFGFGFRFKFGEEEELAGLRIPLGFTYAIGETSMDAFFEFVPIWNFGTSEDLTMNIAAGVHYFFD